MFPVVYLMYYVAVKYRTYHPFTDANVLPEYQRYISPKNHFLYK